MYIVIVVSPYFSQPAQNRSAGLLAGCSEPAQNRSAGLLAGCSERLSVLVNRYCVGSRQLREFFEAWAIFPPDVRGGADAAPAPRCSSVWMSRSRLFLDGLVSTRARLRFAGWCQYALDGCHPQSHAVRLYSCHPQSGFSGLGIEPHQQLVSQRDADYSGWLAGSAESSLEVDEVRLVRSEEHTSELQS